ncbi:MAG TPA: OmpA family protein [Gemmatimonadales bacterium]|nr:OmpA family protein [Gemmatimonadales bacterium]
MRFSIPLMAGVGFIVTALACGGNPPPPPPAPAVNEDSIRAAEEAARRAREDSIARARAEAERLARERALADSLARLTAETERVRGMLTAVINFDYDKSNIRPGDAAILDQKIAILQANPNLRISITGHCDERGSDEYNLALGNRRALAAREYMVNRGITADRIETASRGEEQPVDPASTEDAWARNRRDEFAVTAGGEQLRAPGGM